jgi:hypothetical protein
MAMCSNHGIDLLTVFPFLLEAFICPSIGAEKFDFLRFTVGFRGYVEYIDDSLGPHASHGPLGGLRLATDQLGGFMDYHGL